MSGYFYGLPPPTSPDTTPQSRRAIRKACWEGTEPAEALTAVEREHLVYELWCFGWTDAEIAAHTRMSTYTVGRIRERLGLAAHPRPSEGAA
jgi:hypothetical protein